MDGEVIGNGEIKTVVESESVKQPQPKSLADKLRDHFNEFKENHPFKELSSSGDSLIGNGTVTSEGVSDRLRLEEINAKLTRIEEAQERQRNARKFRRGVITAGLVVLLTAALGRSENFNESLANNPGIGSSTVQAVTGYVNEVISDAYKETVVDTVVDQMANVVDNVYEMGSPFEYTADTIEELAGRSK